MVREAQEADSPASKRAMLLRHSVRRFLPHSNLQSWRAMTPQSVLEFEHLEHINALNKAVEPQDKDRLDKAFEDLCCLQCLWLDMEQEESVQTLLEEIPIMLEKFHESLQKVIGLEDLLNFQRGFRELKKSWATDPVEFDFVAAAEVQLNGREIMMQVIEHKVFPFHYKHREHKGYALHVLALHPQGDDLLSHLLESQADPTKYCTSCSKNKTTLSLPIHVAAGGGQLASAELLLQAKVDIDVVSYVEQPDDQEEGGKVKRVLRLPEVVKRVAAGGGGGKSSMQMVPSASASGSGSGSGATRRFAHYTALHEATFFQQEQMVKFLLYQRAGVNITNLAGDSALHWAARQGNTTISRLLVNSMADLKLVNKEGKTPLETAIETGNFPGARLGMLMQRQISEIMTVAKTAPNAAKELLRDADEGGTISPSWRPRLVDRVTVEQWVELMELAPQVAEDVLEAVTITPEAENNDHYPLPRQACFSESENMRVKYSKDDKWTFNATSGHGAPWHKQLIPKKKNFENKMLRNLQRACGFERKPALVRVRMVRIHGLMNRQVLRALKDTYHLEVFTKLPAQAIIECAWHTVVKRFYWVHCFYRIVEMCILVAWTFLHAEDGLFREACWSWLLVCAFRELFYELCEIRGYMLMRQGYFVSAYLMDAKNLFDFSSIFLLLLLLVQSWHDQRLEGYLPLLACVVASRWVQLVYTFRAFPNVGQKVLPIIQSFRPLSGIFFITSFVFMGFLHAFLVLNTELQTEETSWLVFTSTFRFLFLGDGDAVDVILGLGGRDTAMGDHVTRFFLVLGIMGFSILILNLFIAGAHQAYEEAHQNAETRFFQERADICLQCLFRPTFPGKPLRYPALLIISLSIPAWLAMLAYSPGHPAVASAILFALIILSDSILLQHSWCSKSRLGGSEQVAPEEDGDAKEGGPSEAEDTDAPVTSSTPTSLPTTSNNKRMLAPWDQKYLWFAYRVECEECGDGGESSYSGSSLMSRKALEHMQRNRMGYDVRRLRRDSENMHYEMNVKLVQLKEGMIGVGQDMSGRLDKLEQSVKGIMASIERISAGGHAESQLPEGWESARAASGRVYYFNRALKRRQWERPTAGSAVPTPSGGAGGRPALLPGIRSKRNLDRSITRTTTGSSYGSGTSRGGTAASVGLSRRDQHADVVLGPTPACSPIAELPGDVLSGSVGTSERGETPSELGQPDHRSSVHSGQSPDATGAPETQVPSDALVPPAVPDASALGQPPAGGAPLPGAAVRSAPAGEPGAGVEQRQRPGPLVDLT